jgi:ubiquinone/menaquinone biosynthesis C-methylase UbiE
MVKQLEARVRDAGLANVTSVQADLYDLRFADGSFDAVFAANVLHLVPDLERALESLRRVLKPGGLLIAPTYLHRETLAASVLSRVFALTGFPGHRRFTLSTLRTAIREAGFEISLSQVVAGPFPVGFMSAVAR